MARRLSIPRLTKRIPQLDAELAELLAGDASPELVEAFIVRNFLPVAYIFALRLNRSHTMNDERQDEVSEMAISAIDDVVAKVRSGSFRFRGDSRFSTYLFSTLKRMRRVKAYVPRAVTALGAEAEHCFRLLYVEGREPDEARQVMRAELSLSEERIDELLRSVTGALAGNPVAQRLRAGRQAVEIDPTEPATQHLTVAPGDTPEETFLRGTLQERVEAVLEAMPEEDRHIILLRFVSGMSIREVGRRLGLRSPQYRFEQARERFFAEAERLDVRGLYEALTTKDGSHG